MRESHDFFDLVFKHSPSQGTLFLVLSKMKEDGLKGEVIRECIKALNIYPDNIRLRTLLGEAYLEAGFIGQAEMELEKATSDIAGLTSAFKLQADIYAQQGRDEEALVSLKRYLTHNPNDLEALELLERINPAEPEPAAITPEIPEEPLPEAKEEREAVAHLKTPEFPKGSHDPEKDEVEAYSDEGELVPDIQTTVEQPIELNAQIIDEQITEIPSAEDVTAKKEKLIAILEEWQEKFQELSHVKQSPSV